MAGRGERRLTAGKRAGTFVCAACFLPLLSSRAS